MVEYLGKLKKRLRVLSLGFDWIGLKLF